MKPGWYLRRLSRMSAGEVAWRVGTMARRRLWRVERARWRPAVAVSADTAVRLKPLPPPSQPDGAPAAALRAAAEELLAGRWRLLSVERDDLGEAPDWFRDPVTGRRAPAKDYCFAVPYRDEARIGNVKQVWELSRHQHLTLLAAAWWLTRDHRFAERVAAHLGRWWRENPFLAGVHWTSAIEVGIRLLSWTWIRALLGDWPGAAALFEANPVFRAQLHAHQRYVDAFRSRGSSANNHLILELAGLAASATAFHWIPASARWRDGAWRDLDAALATQTHADGLNREQASDYHQFVLEAALAAAAAGRLCGHAVPPGIGATLVRMADALAATLDATGRPPRMGDGDDGRGLVVDAPDGHAAGGHVAPPEGGTNLTAAMLEAVAAIAGRPAWWPPLPTGSMLAQLVTAAWEYGPASGDLPARPAARPHRFDGAGQAFLRTAPDDPAPEIWCRCDHGPHGYLSIAAHGHADALSIELRVGGVDVLADPGTYCYHGEPEWRRAFRGTLGHNTVEIDGRDQADQGGPFLWTTLPQAHFEALEGLDGGPIARWQARHDGYARLADPVVHRRAVTLDRVARTLEIVDRLEAQGEHDLCLAFHLGPAVECRLDGARAHLRWDAAGAVNEALLLLPAGLRWQARRGESEPPLGWYSAGFGAREPATVLIGSGRLQANRRLVSRLDLSTAIA